MEAVSTPVTTTTWSLLRSKHSPSLPDQVHYTLVLGLAYQECLIIIRYQIFIAFWQSVSDQNQMRTQQLWNWHYRVRHSTVISACSPQQQIIHHAVTRPRPKVDHCLKKDKYPLQCVNRKQLLMPAIIFKEVQCIYVWIYHVVIWPRLKTDKYVTVCHRSSFLDVLCAYAWMMMCL